MPSRVGQTRGGISNEKTKILPLGSAKASRPEARPEPLVGEKCIYIYIYICIVTIMIIQYNAESWYNAV